MDKINKWKLTARMANYIVRNKKLSPLNNLEYVFLRDLYRYLTKQFLDQESKNRLYKNYARLLDICYFPNKPEFNYSMMECIYLQCLILLERDYESPYTFILLNNETHFKRMKGVLKVLYNWARNSEKGHILDPHEFWDTLSFIRKEFNADRITDEHIYYNVGKWPKKLRKRFHRKDSNGILFARR